MLLIHAHSHQGSKRKQGSFFVGLLSLIIEEGGQRVHAFNTICKCSTRPKLTLVPLDLSSTFLGMRWYRETLWPSWRICFNSSLSGTHTHTQTRNTYTHIVQLCPCPLMGNDTRSNFLKYWLAWVKDFITRKVINERWQRPTSLVYEFSSRGTFSSISLPNWLNIALSAQRSRRQGGKNSRALLNAGFKAGHSAPHCVAHYLMSF